MRTIDMLYVCSSRVIIAAAMYIVLKRIICDGNFALLMEQLCILRGISNTLIFK